MYGTHNLGKKQVLWSAVGSLRFGEQGVTWVEEAMSKNMLIDVEEDEFADIIDLALCE